MAVVNRLDLVFLGLSLPVFLVAGLSMPAWLIIAAAWLIQRFVRGWAIKTAKETDDPRTLVGLLAGSLIGRGWFIAISIFACGMIYGSKAGLSAALLAVALFTVMFTVEMLFRPFDEAESK
ncbi:MAG: hypothetical protein NTY57_07940 [Solirubrobacterales bacterium]|nr:hypothetical protein [Solirubrobacterales bacterium]